MTAKNSEKTRARELQERTGWGYSECLQRIRTMTPEGIEALIKIRGTQK